MTSVPEWVWLIGYVAVAGVIYFVILLFAKKPSRDAELYIMAFGLVWPFSLFVAGVAGIFLMVFEGAGWLARGTRRLWLKIRAKIGRAKK